MNLPVKEMLAQKRKCTIAGVQSLSLVNNPLSRNETVPRSSGANSFSFISLLFSVNFHKICNKTWKREDVNLPLGRGVDNTAQSAAYSFPLVDTCVAERTCGAGALTLASAERVPPLSPNLNVTWVSTAAEGDSVVTSCLPGSKFGPHPPSIISSSRPD